MEAPLSSSVPRGMTHAHAEPPTLPIQPVPLFALLARTPDGKNTAITRRWPEGRSESCRLCPAGRCRAVQDVCLVLAPGKVSDADAIMYSTLELPRIS